MTVIEIQAFNHLHYSCLWFIVFKVLHYSVKVIYCQAVY